MIPDPLCAFYLIHIPIQPSRRLDVTTRHVPIG